jgi:predicted RNA binding protein YcfA (HicA-like mRNA interferase family)
MRRIRQRNLANIDFADFQRTVEYYGFKLIRIRGSHHIYLNAVHGLQLNLQPKSGQANLYQVTQFLKLVEKHRITPRIRE